MKPLYLTIDDAPSPLFAQKAAYLYRHRVPAVFFCIGSYMEQYREEVIAAIRNGFVIGNHSWSHPNFSTISITQARAEIQRTDELIEELYQRAGVQRPAKWFRFPYGDKADGRRGRVLSKWPAWRKSKKNAIQEILRDFGYTQPVFEGMDYSFYEKAGLLQDIDCHWTFDVMEWTVIMPAPVLGIKNDVDVLVRLRSSAPADCRGRIREQHWLGKEKSAEIVLIHDHSKSDSLFYAVLGELRQRPFRFALPRAASGA